jgi:hypothetical protein
LAEEKKERIEHCSDRQQLIIFIFFYEFFINKIDLMIQFLLLEILFKDAVTIRRGYYTNISNFNIGQTNKFVKFSDALRIVL